MKIRIIYLSILLFSYQGLFVAPIWAWDNNNAHPMITQKAIKLFMKTLSEDEKVIFEFNAFHCGGEQCQFIDEGAVKEDMGKSPEQVLPVGFEDSWDLAEWGDDACSVDQYTWLSHAYNPVTGQTWQHKDLYDSGLNDQVSDVNALARAVKIWVEMRQLPDSQKSTLSYLMLGRLCHLVQDVTSPAHVHADFHGTGDDIEEYAKANITEIMNQLPPLTIKHPKEHGLTAQFHNRDDLRETDSISSFMKNLAYRTYYMTSFYGGQLRRGDTQPDSELTKMFPSLRYRSSVFSPSVGVEIGIDCWDIKGIGEYCVYEDGVLGEEGNNDWWECPEDPGYFYIENTKGIQPTFFKKKEYMFTRITSAAQLDDAMEENTEGKTLPQLYVENLFPLAIEWTAGLIQSQYKWITAPKSWEKKECECYVLNHSDVWPLTFPPTYHTLYEKLESEGRLNDCTCYFRKGVFRGCKSASHGYSSAFCE